MKDRTPREVIPDKEISIDQPITFMQPCMSTNGERSLPILPAQQPIPVNPFAAEEEGARFGHQGPNYTKEKFSNVTSPIPYKGNFPSSKNQYGFKPGCTPVTDLLLPEASTMVYTDEFLNQPNAKLFLQNVQPNIFSYAVDTTPINALANGISYTPQVPPKFRDQVYNRQDGMTWPIYTRVDPQLIRDDGAPSRILEQPIRNDWSAKYSNWEAPEGSINYEDIYDPRFTSYGDPYRSYTDVNLGQVQYYYSDVDAYRYPNFITRSKIDFIEFEDPQNRVKPYYIRTAGLNDTRPFVSDQWVSDSNYFRESITESNMRKILAEQWQTRFAPLSKANHTTYFTSGPR